MGQLEEHRDPPTVITPLLKAAPQTFYLVLEHDIKNTSLGCTHVSLKICIHFRIVFVSHPKKKKITVRQKTLTLGIMTLKY